MADTFGDVPATCCDICPTNARWSVCNLEGADAEPVARWFACGRHLNAVLDRNEWEYDSVHVYDLSAPVARS